MEDFERKLNTVLAFAALFLAVIALFFAVFKGAWHQCFVAAISFVLYMGLMPAKKE